MELVIGVIENKFIKIIGDIASIAIMIGVTANSGQMYWVNGHFRW